MEKVLKTKETREKEKIAGITALGWVFIILSFIFVFGAVNQASPFYKYSNDMLSKPMEVRGLLPKLIIPVSVGFLYLFLIGVGILRLKRWAYYSVFIVIFMYCMSIMKFIVVFGFQFLNKYLIFALLFGSIVAIIFLLKEDVIKQFNADFINKKNRRIYPQRVLRHLLCYLAIVSILLISVSFFAAKDSFLNIVPQKIRYQADKNYLLNNCQKRDVFDYSIYIPDDFVIVSVSKGDSDSMLGWILSLVERDSIETPSFIVLESESRYSSLFSKMLGFKTVYDFEKAINSPSSSSPVILSIFRSVSIANLRDLVSIDDATGYAWKGFIRIYNLKDKERLFYDASLYSLQNDKTCKVIISFRDKLMLPKQAKSIIASVEFKDSGRDARSIFEEGKAALSRGDFISAGINFMNAFYLNEQKPEYAYYLSRVLFEDTNKEGKKSRLKSSREFLECAIKFNPEYQEANELLILVDNEIKQVEQNK